MLEKGVVAEAIDIKDNKNLMKSSSNLLLRESQKALRDQLKDVMSVTRGFSY